MKKLIAGAALITTLLSTGAVALAETPTTDPSAIELTPSAEVVEVTGPEESTEVTAAEVEATAEDTTGGEAEESTEAENGDEATVEDAGAVVLPDAGLTPDNFFYGLKLLVERIQVLITSDAAQKAALLEQQAQIRLAEAKAMAEKGQDDLAQRALKEAEAKLAEAQKAIQAAAAVNGELGDLKERVEADQAKYALVLTRILEKAPEELREELEPVVTDLLVAVAETQDTVAEDEAAAEEAEAVVEETALEEDLAGVAPRTVLVLKAMAEAADVDLTEVVEMYQENPGLGRIAKELGLKMGPVQHAAQIEWKLSQETFEAEAEESEVEESEAEGSTEAVSSDEDRDNDDDRDEDRDDDDDDDEAKAKNWGQYKKAEKAGAAISKGNGKGKNH